MLPSHEECAGYVRERMAPEWFSLVKGRYELSPEGLAAMRARWPAFEGADFIYAYVMLPLLLASYEGMELERDAPLWIRGELNEKNMGACLARAQGMSTTYFGRSLFSNSLLHSFFHAYILRRMCALEPVVLGADAKIVVFGCGSPPPDFFCVTFADGTKAFLAVARIEKKWVVEHAPTSLGAPPVRFALETPPDTVEVRFPLAADRDGRLWRYAPESKRFRPLRERFGQPVRLFRLDNEIYVKLYEDDDLQTVKRVTHAEVE